MKTINFLIVSDEDGVMLDVLFCYNIVSRGRIRGTIIEAIAKYGKYCEYELVEISIPPEVFNTWDEYSRVLGLTARKQAGE